MVKKNKVWKMKIFPRMEKSGNFIFSKENFEKMKKRDKNQWVLNFPKKKVSVNDIFFLSFASSCAPADRINTQVIYRL